MKNFRQRYLFPNSDLRGEYVHLDSALAPVLHARNYPLEIQSQLAEALAQILTTEELLDLPLDTILHRLFHETSPDLAAAMDLHFACTCSREKVEVMLQSLGTEELQSLLDEQGGADVCCEFCRHNQHSMLMN